MKRRFERSFRLFSKRGYPKRTWGACFGSLADANDAWAEYKLHEQNVLAQGLILERCKSRGEEADPPAASAAAALVQNNTQHIGAIREVTIGAILQKRWQRNWRGS